MGPLIEAAFSTVNLPYTILMIVLTLYWLIVLVGLLDLDPFGLDADPGASGDSFGDGAGDGVGGADGHAPTLVQSVLGFFNVGEVPLMFIVSIAALSMWVVSLQANHYLESFVADYQPWFALALAIPNLLFGMLLAKFLTTPLKWLNIDRVQETPLVGKPCRVVSMEVTDRSGQCEVRTGAAPLTLNACTRNGEVLVKGDAAVIVERDKRNNLYTVTKYHGEV